MTTVEHIDHDLKEAMKSKNELTLSTLRMARSALKNKQIDMQRELTEDEAQAVVRTMVKQYRDALADFVAASRQDLADRQTQEIQILETYLPAPLSSEELEGICTRVIAEMNATSKDMGKVIGAVIKEAGARADGSVVRETLQRLFNSSTS